MAYFSLLTEQDIMVLLIELDINTPKLPGYSKNVISTENRRYLKAATGITGDNLSRYRKIKR